MKDITKAELDKIVAEIVEEVEDDAAADDEETPDLSQEELLKRISEKIGEPWRLV